MSDFISHLKGANRSIAFLASHLDLTAAVVDELERWLNRSPNLQRRSRLQLASAIASCRVIVEDIEEHVAKVRPRPGEGTSTFKQKVTLIWNDTIIREHQEALSHSLQAFQILIKLYTALNTVMPSAG